MSEHDEKSRKHQIQCPKCESPDVRHLVEPFLVTPAKKS